MVEEYEFVIDYGTQKAAGIGVFRERYLIPYLLIEIGGGNDKGQDARGKGFKNLLCVYKYNR